MLKKNPEAFALYIALIATLIILMVFLADLLLARHRAIEAGEARIQQFSETMAEHTARSFDAINILLREVAGDLANNRKNWENWDSKTGWEYVVQRHSRAMPQLRELVIFDREGNQRFVSDYFPPPTVNIKDRPYFSRIEEGAETTTYGPIIGRNSGRYTYALTRRIPGNDNRFAGVVFAAIEPAYLHDFCWSNRLSEDAETVLINAKGEVVASCHPTDLSHEAPIIGNHVHNTLFGGKLPGQIPDSGLLRVNGLLVSIAPINGFSDLRILAAIPEETLLSGWHNRMVEFGTLGLFVIVVLLVGTQLIRRQVHAMSSMTVELAASHDNLETRVQMATLELAGQKEAAELANSAKSRFLAAASHDLRQPLHALSLFAADLQRQVNNKSYAELPRLAEQIAASTGLLGELLDALLDISRIDVAGIQPDIRPFPLSPVFERLNNFFRRTAVDRNISLIFRHSSHWLNSDPAMVERLLANLLSNALRYTPPGGRVLVASRRRGDEILLEVRDNGIGIAPEHQSAIFDEFYQVGNAAREQTKGLGLGLGLSIVARLAHALDARFGVESRLGEGSCFWFYLESSAPLGRNLPEPAPAKNGKVYCIGSSSHLMACAEMAESWNYAVTFETPEEAAASPTPTCIIADADGLETAIRIKSADSPLIVLTDASDPLPPGAHGLPLPVRPARLRALLNQLQKTLAKSIS